MEQATYRSQGRKRTILYSILLKFLILNNSRLILKLFKSIFLQRKVFGNIILKYKNFEKLKSNIIWFIKILIYRDCKNRFLPMLN